MKTDQTKPADAIGLGALLRPVRPRLGTAIGLQAVGAVVAVVPFAAVAELAEVLLTDGPVDENRAWTVAAIAAGALMVWLALTTLAGALAHGADLDFQLSVRRRLVDRLGRVPLGWFTDRGAGGVGKAVQHDVDTMHHLVAHALLNLTTSVVTPLATLVYLFWVDWRMALILLIPIAVGLALFLRMMLTMESQTAAFDEAQQRIVSRVVEFVEGIAVVKMFGQARRAHRQYGQAADDFAEFFLAWISKSYRASAASELAMSPVTVLLTVLTGGTALVSAGHLPAVDLLPFAILGLGLAGPMQALHYYSHDVEKAGAAAKRVGALLAAPELAVPAAPRQPRLDGGARVELSGVEFGYDTDRPVLSDIDLVLEPGTVTALVGTSGSGKTTLAKLLPRFFDPTAGTVTIGGVDLRDIAPDRLYRLVSFVLQDVQLLDASVRDNIRLARPEADEETVRRAARAAAVDERVEALPRGYDSVVGRDVRFSGGEAQRLSIARAILADTPIVVLDEATAHADPESEALIQDALSELAAGRTVLVVAHRLASVVGVDRIVVLEQGRMVEQGTHEELLAAGGRYARMWRLQERSGLGDAGDHGVYAGAGAAKGEAR
ncbi:ABC transporter ATP-binding protein [Streptomyces sp. SAJ15]|uniref:ABC transporter ATP-binding protein n=1 Tax=Streptomyces sp. SAJ15 TaxID=2011095 RepID=UPI001186C2B1|nr:ABC transporter ATP-binding protein [Streptomyces sp. SAJ15]TVL91161.1 ABC transporter [Streptomyces sp. SAJ15]